MRNLSLLTDLYEFSMANGFHHDLPRTNATFDLFYRRVPDNGSFVIAAGLQQVVEALQDFHFTSNDLDYFRQLNLWDERFLTTLAHFKLTCQIKALPEGTPVFPREPLLTITGPLEQAQLLETLVLNIVNHQSLIATKARRLSYAAAGRPIMEFGARRAQGPDSAIYGTRAAIIGGANSTSNVLAAKQFGIPVAGTMAHSWVEAFPDELTAFRKWAEQYPDNSALLVDTYDVLNSGIPNAITVFKELRAAGHKPVGIRIDSGDVTTLSQAARSRLDAAGFPNAKITISNALDEHIITSLLQEGAPIDNFGIGEKLITSASAPVLSGVYKLAATEIDGQHTPKIKVSASREKLTIPGDKQVYRLYEPGTQRAFADLIALATETITGQSSLTVVNSNPLSVDRQQRLTNFDARPLLVPVDLSTTTMIPIPAIQAATQAKLAELPRTTQRLVNPDIYPVYMTTTLSQLQTKLLNEMTILAN
ncbi:nicotinate phosphoribosyltransferase [Lactiplantibacillus paraplantarum]|uniref:nicotinate phosphoribosyltransferase n=1 Tax=Lactiplantibacillus paraplantarum TaxID=60520 RepID=UPI0005130A03|nr:nicotinate phosphoribosyltransferase [Lactiplantibacillus paraplantarum]OAX76360.1 nicotinate phosphoribosyltransferase [Lactiplantibacillus plantarum]ALO04968.1 nicotinate phosphoribosyltransferase [Lactiplantibacillus paraplantarum]KGE76537.1 nicotinate phosphoribosyltransferase [Lactiplantibacillus paraplantarum]MCW1911081.1 nicotinate phosphoribosyltransferase [Lactiplantibacillus paraplantarum]RDG12285.1 nicotinate phosphoribosyltransferase [Lactiplantibacillus paraplantarum]